MHGSVPRLVARLHVRLRLEARSHGADVSCCGGLVKPTPRLTTARLLGARMHLELPQAAHPALLASNGERAVTLRIPSKVVCLRDEQRLDETEPVSVCSEVERRV